MEINLNKLLYIIPVILLNIWIQKYLIKFCHKKQLFDMPGKRKVHCEPVPRIGGLGIFISFAILFFAFDLFSIWTYKIIFLSASFLFFINLIDDLKPGGINNKIKLFIQILLSSILFFMGVKVTLFIDNEIITFLLTVIWITGITNSMNLIDNMNGLSSGLGIISSLFFAYTFYQQANNSLFYMCIILASSILPFFLFNYPKGRIFMGDCGANLIGFLLATISVSGTYLVNSRLSRLPVIAPLIILSVPIYDTLSVMIIRKIKGYSVFSPDKNHISHRISNMGISNNISVLIIFLISIICSIGAIILPDLYLRSALIMLLQLFILYILITILVYAGKKN